MTEGEFRHLLEETRKAFEISYIKQFAEGQCPKLEWYYSVCATRIEPERLFILGFNWGAKDGECYCPQKNYPSESFMELGYNELGSLDRVKPWLSKYLPEKDLKEIGQSNFCFFRSKRADQITSHDRKLCHPLISKLINMARPKTIIGLSAQLRDHLLPSCQSVKTHDLMFERGAIKVTYKIAKGEFKSIPICFLPHPAYRLPKQKVEEAWSFCLP